MTSRVRWSGRSGLSVEWSLQGSGSGRRRFGASREKSLHFSVVRMRLSTGSWSSKG